jgi:hypothetical protein
MAVCIIAAIYNVVRHRRMLQYVPCFLNMLVSCAVILRQVYHINVEGRLRANIEPQHQINKTKTVIQQILVTPNKLFINLVLFFINMIHCILELSWRLACPLH